MAMATRQGRNPAGSRSKLRSRRLIPPQGQDLPLKAKGEMKVIVGHSPGHNHRINRLCLCRRLSKSQTIDNGGS